jgi:hypothetical protein
MTHPWLAALGVLVAAALVACGGGDDSPSPAAGATEVRPFSEVQASDFAFEADPTAPGRGIFRVTTTEDMICAVVWGETEQLGRFNNSLSMNGTGITQHDVFLPGAEAGQTYFFLVQGTTADGTLYRSELATFTIAGSTAAAAPTRDDLGPNLALDAAVAEVSSEFSEAWVAANAIDGDLATEWSSAASGDDAFITLDFASAVEIAAIEFVTRSMADGSATTTTFTILLDGAHQFGPFDASTLANPAVHTIEETATSVRFDVETSSGGNTGAVEIRVFAPR